MFDGEVVHPVAARAERREAVQPTVRARPDNPIGRHMQGIYFIGSQTIPLFDFRHHMLAGLPDDDAVAFGAEYQTAVGQYIHVYKRLQKRRVLHVRADECTAAFPLEQAFVAGCPDPAVGGLEYTAKPDESLFWCSRYRRTARIRSR